MIVGGKLDSKGIVISDSDPIDVNREVVLDPQITLLESAIQH